MKRIVSILAVISIMLTACDVNPQKFPDISERQEETVKSTSKSSKPGETVKPKSEKGNPVLQSAVEGKVNLALENREDREFLAESAEKEIVFIAEFVSDSIDNCPEIKLVDSESGELKGIMLDNGEYSQNGDTIGGDGWYSCRIKVDISKERDYSFKAVFTPPNSAEIASEPVEITVIEPFTDEELDGMEEVRVVLDEWIQSNEFQSASIEKRAEGTIKVLEELVERDLVVRGSVTYSGGDMVGYEFAAGGLGGVMLKAFDPRMN